MAYKMKCLICNHTENDLVRLQEHAMNEHKYTVEDLRANTKRETDNGLVYTFPDGVDWMLAVKLGNFLGGL